jgi:hypothetical protein
LRSIVADIAQSWRNVRADRQNASPASEVVDSAKSMNEIRIGTDEECVVVVFDRGVVDKIRHQQRVYALFLYISVRSRDAVAENDSNTVRDMKPVGGAGAVQMLLDRIEVSSDDLAAAEVGTYDSPKVIVEAEVMVAQSMKKVRPVDEDHRLLKLDRLNRTTCNHAGDFVSDATKYA